MQTFTKSWGGPRNGDGEGVYLSTLCAVTHGNTGHATASTKVHCYKGLLSNAQSQLRKSHMLQLAHCKQWNSRLEPCMSTCK